MGLSSNQNEKEEEEHVPTPCEKRAALIAAMGRFRPKDATPIQYYNYVREFCIMHNCSIDEAMDRAPEAWTKLSENQRALYNSEMHAALPIPVPRHLIYRAFKMERVGRWKINCIQAPNGHGISYIMEAYTPPSKPTRMQARLRAQQPRYDNLAENSPCCIENPRTPKGTSSGSPKKVRTLTPPEQRAQRAQQEKGAQSLSLTRILSEVSLKGKRSGREKAALAANAFAKRPSKDKDKEHKPQDQYQELQQLPRGGRRDQTTMASNKSKKLLKANATRPKTTTNKKKSIKLPLPTTEPKRKLSHKQYKKKS